jgi:hypothetical protein
VILFRPLNRRATPRLRDEHLGHVRTAPARQRKNGRICSRIATKVRAFRLQPSGFSLMRGCGHERRHSSRPRVRVTMDPARERGFGSRGRRIRGAAACLAGLRSDRE